MEKDPLLGRRQFLGAGLLGAAGAGLAACSATSAVHATTSTSGAPTPTTRPAATILQAGARPYPNMAVGTDMLPEIEHIVVCMMENHSFDNVLGMLGRGDGFTLGSDGLPTAANPYMGKTLHAFPMPTVCQQDGHPSNDWYTAHKSYDGGKNDGFANSFSGPVSMGYFTKEQMPFTYGLAETFPINDRYFCSVMAQTYPNRRFLISGTSFGLTADTFPKGLPPNGVIYQTLDRHGISWRNYYSDTPSILVYIDLINNSTVMSNVHKIDQFFADAKAGNLPSFCLIEPNYGHSSEEDPQDVQYGDQFLSTVVQAVMASPNWSKTLFIWNYDEHGGYYDHVPPPFTVTPDDVPPTVGGAFNQYGFRVPMGIVSPYARPDYVSHAVSDHTSVLNLVETKWNLPALTRRDANAHNLLDMVDLSAAPAFATPPSLPAPLDPAMLAGCLTTGAGTIPPTGSVSA